MPDHCTSFPSLSPSQPPTYNVSTLPNNHCKCLNATRG